MRTRGKTMYTNESSTAPILEFIVVCLNTKDDVILLKFLVSPCSDPPPLPQPPTTVSLLRELMLGCEISFGCMTEICHPCTLQIQTERDSIDSFIQQWSSSLQTWSQPGMRHYTWLLPLTCRRIGSEGGGEGCSRHEETDSTKISRLFSQVTLYNTL